HRTFAIPRSPGFTEITLGQVAPEEAIRRTNVPGLSVLPSGVAPPSPAELLGSERVRRLFEELSAGVDIMIVDAPPVLLASDASVLARLVDGMIMVVRAGQTDRVAAQHARQQLDAVGANIIGAVLNDPDAELQRYGSYYSEGYYGEN
ncbi:MAG TPA: CpsD/CapB family tyrosine-protein kinase, partial [Steroidobacteraceae bacterium]